MCRDLRASFGDIDLGSLEDTKQRHVASTSYASLVGVDLSVYLSMDDTLDAVDLSVYSLMDN